MARVSGPSSRRPGTSACRSPRRAASKSAPCSGWPGSPSSSGCARLLDALLSGAGTPSRAVDARVGDELREFGPTHLGLAQLEATLDGVEVRVALVQDALVVRAEGERGVEGRARVEVDRLELEIAPGGAQ